MVYIDVDVDDWNFGKGEQTLRSLGAGGCIIVALHSVDNEFGLVSHFLDVDDTGAYDVDELGKKYRNDFWEATRTTLLPREATTVFVGGGALYDDIDGESVDVDRLERNRENVIRTLADLGFTDPTIRWVEEDEDLSIELNCQTGELIVEVET